MELRPILIRHLSRMFKMFPQYSKYTYMFIILFSYVRANEDYLIG